MYELQDSSVGFIELFVRILVVDRGVILVQNVGVPNFLSLGVVLVGRP